MPIRRSVIAILAATLLLPGVLGCAFTLAGILDFFSDLERTTMEDRVREVRGEYEREANRLTTLAIDWGQWDSALNFANNPSDKEMRSWLLSPSSYTIQGVELLAFLRIDGSVLFGVWSDNEKEVVTELSESDGKGMKPLLAQLYPGSKYGDLKRGVAQFKGQPYLVASVPVLDIAKNGGGKAFLVVASRINDAFWKRIVSIPRLTVSSKGVDNSSSTSDQLIMTSDSVSAAIKLKDVEGNDGLLLSIQSGREFFNHARIASERYLLGLAGLGILALLGTLALLDKQLVRRFASLERDVSKVSQSQNFSLRLEVRGDDELTRLSTSINSMLSSLEKAHSELDATRRAADRANNSKASFISRVSHELRTPIFTMQGYLRMLSKTKLEGEAQGHAIKLQSAAEQLLTVVNEVLDFAELTNDEITLLPSEVSIESILKEAVADHGALLRDKPDIEVAIRVASDIPARITVDERRLTQLVHSLVSNAVKFTANGNIDIEAEAIETGLKLSFRDTGIGMDRDEISHAFTAFEQFGEALSQRYEGLGLGLSLTKKFVETMGGSVVIDSSPGRGTVVTVLLPIEFERRHAPPHLQLVYSSRDELPLQENSAPAPLRVLIAEDVPSNRELIRVMIENLGHIVECVDDGTQLVNRLGDHIDKDDDDTFDIVLADLYMPGCDGIEAIRRTRLAEEEAGIVPARRVPIVVLTASGSTLEALKVKAVGGDGFLVKPVGQARLAEALKSALATRRTLSSK